MTDAESHKGFARAVGTMAVSKKQTNETSSDTAVPKGSLASVVKKLLKTGKDKGFLTYDELNEAMPSEE